MNWNQAQTVTVSGQNDDVDDGDITYSIQVLPAVSSDRSTTASTRRTF
ncbi:MAG: hypothetical protein R3C59_14675 [Planctomycetaceae bacterium]